MSAAEIVLAWHDALNGQDVHRLLELSSGEIEVGGPRGSSQGHEALRDWVERARIQLLVRSVSIVGEDTVVAEEDASWPGQDGATPVPPMRVASVFRVVDGLVASVVRWESLDAAFGAVGPPPSDFANQSEKPTAARPGALARPERGRAGTRL